MKHFIRLLLISLSILLIISMVLNHAKSLSQKYSEYPNRLCIIDSSNSNKEQSQEVLAITSNSVYSLEMTTNSSLLKINQIEDLSSDKIKDCSKTMKYIPNKEDNLKNVCLSTLSNSIYTNFELCNIIKHHKGNI